MIKQVGDKIFLNPNAKSEYKNINNLLFFNCQDIFENDPHTNDCRSIVLSKTFKLNEDAFGPAPLPFKAIFVESLAGSLMYNDKDDFTAAWLFEAATPPNWAGFLISKEVKDPIKVSSLYNDDASTLIKRMLISINSSANVTGAIPIPRQMRHRLTGKMREVRRIVYCTGKKGQRSEHEALGQKIDWSHSWEVRGHWRSINGLGKDRDGHYCINGHTWVLPHQKGEGDLVVKTRFFLGEKIAAPNN